MADGIAITAGAGTTILTDDTGAGGHAQVVKLAISTDGSGTLIPADASNGIDVDVTRMAALVTGTAAIGQVGLEPRTSGGLSVYKHLAAATTNSTNVKASAGQLYGWYVANLVGSWRYLKLYNLAAAPTVGTSAVFMTVPIPAGSAATVEITNGVAMGTGIGFGITTGVADNDTGACAANDVVVNLLYK